MPVITAIHSRQILDSRGNPTVEVECYLDDGSIGTAAVPSGASTGEHEALELRDQSSSYFGKSVYQAIDNVNNIIGPALLGHNSGDIYTIDKMIGITELDLLQIVKGPDFPTGGILVEAKETIELSYKTGRGGFRLRARWNIEKLKAGQWQIIVTEIPYQVQKSCFHRKLCKRIGKEIFVIWIKYTYTTK